MPEQDRVDLATLQAALEEATHDAKELMRRLSAQLEEQTLQRRTHLLDPTTRQSAPKPDDH
jgi:hypothetical protein